MTDDLHPDGQGLGPGDAVFHEVGTVLGEQEVLVVPMGMRAPDAIELMDANGYSQVPIVTPDNEVIGVFSYRSFARTGAALPANEHPADLTVEEAREHPEWVSPTDGVSDQYDSLDRDNAVLVGDPMKCLGVLTPVDVLRYMDELVEPFVLFGEIEPALRTAVGAGLDGDGLAEAAGRALAGRYANREEPVPVDPERMTLGELVDIVFDGAAWAEMKSVLGQNRRVAQTHLGCLAPLRNRILHFRGALSQEELGQIRACREWLFLRLKGAQLARRPRA